MPGGGPLAREQPRELTCFRSLALCIDANFSRRNFKEKEAIELSTMSDGSSNAATTSTPTKDAAENNQQCCLGVLYFSQALHEQARNPVRMTFNGEDNGSHVALCSYVVDHSFNVLSCPTL